VSDYYGIGPMRTSAPRGTFVPSAIFFGLVAVFIAAGALAWLDRGSAGFNVFLFVVFGWLITLCLHEYAHALVAYHAGDYGVVRRGYLQLNPLKYANPVFSIVLPLVFIIIGGIALPGGAVMIDHGQLRSKAWDSFVSLAGPAVNAVFAAVLISPFVIGVDIFAHPVFWSAVAVLAFFQVMAAIFNLIPVPGLDGGNAIYPWLTRDGQRGFNAVRPYGFVLAFLLLWQPTINRTFFGWLYSFLSDLGVPLSVLANGLDLFRFWRQ
jgi:Zn-dependent protease